MVACLLPCAWDYWEIGKLLRKQYGDRLKQIHMPNGLKHMILRRLVKELNG